MPTFTPGNPSEWSREDLQLLQNGFVVLFCHEEVLADYVSWLASHHYSIHELDAESWQTSQECQAAIGQILGFPEDFQGHSLDAFRDLLSDVATYELGGDPPAAGTLLVLRHYDGFTTRNRDVARAVLDIWADEARLGLLFGHRMLCFVQSDDPAITFESVGATPVMWNPREWLHSSRQGNGPGRISRADPPE